MMGDIIIICNN